MRKDNLEYALAPQVRRRAWNQYAPRQICASAHPSLWQAWLSIYAALPLKRKFYPLFFKDFICNYYKVINFGHSRIRNGLVKGFFNFNRADAGGKGFFQYNFIFSTPLSGGLGVANLQGLKERLLKQVDKQNQYYRIARQVFEREKLFERGAQKGAKIFEDSAGDIAQKVNDMGRAGGPLLRQGEQPVSVNSKSWMHIKKSPDWRTYRALKDVRDIWTNGELYRKQPNYKARKDGFQAWDYAVKGANSQSDMHLGPSYGNPPIDNIKKNESEVKPYIALTVANGGGKRTLYNITPDLKYYLSGHPAEKERLSRLAPKGSILRSLAENTPLRHSPFRLRDLPQRLSPFGGILANSLYRDVKKEKPYRRGDVFKVFENR